MPALSPAMTDGTIARWHVSEGQVIAAGDLLVEVATRDATLEIEAKDEGRVVKILVPEGTTGVSVNTPIALIGGAEKASVRPLGLLGGSLSVSALPMTATVDPVGSGDAYARMPYWQALRDAQAEELRRDERVVIAGTDVAHNRGAEKPTQGLLDEFGTSRVLSGPLNEGAIASFCAGAALAGLRPVLEVSSWAGAIERVMPAIETFVAARFAAGDDITGNLVIRGPDGGEPGAAGLAGRTCAGRLAQVSGLVVLAPATPADVKGLLKAAIRAPGPVAILESDALYEIEDNVPADPDVLVPIGRARLARTGRDVTLVAYGPMVAVALIAAGQLAGSGIEAEVIDLRTVKPFDCDAIVASVARTGRLVVLEEAIPPATIGAAVIAAVACQGHRNLAAAPLHLCAADVPTPYAAELASSVRPDAQRCSEAVRNMLGR